MVKGNTPKDEEKVQNARAAGEMASYTLRKLIPDLTPAQWLGIYCGLMFFLGTLFFYWFDRTSATAQLNILSERAICIEKNTSFWVDKSGTKLHIVNGSLVSEPIDYSFPWERVNLSNASGGYRLP